MAVLQCSPHIPAGLVRVGLVERKGVDKLHDSSLMDQHITMRNITQLRKCRLPCVLILIATMVNTVSVIDDLALQPHTGTGGIIPVPYLRHPMAFIGTYVVVGVGLGMSTVQNSLGPLVGCSSVLWFIMGNDSPIKPSISWA